MAPKPSREPRPREVARRYGIVLVFLSLCALICAICQYKVISGQWPENVFLTTDNFLLILYQVSINGILAVGMTLVIVSGGIDLSVGSVTAFAGMLAASFATGSEGVTPWSGTYPVIVPLAAALAAGAACGAVNGWVVARFRIQPFIATMGMLLAARGFTMALTNGNPISNLSPALRWFGTGRIFGLPVPVLLLAIVFAAFWVVLRYTRFGRQIYAIGGNSQAAHLSGINVDRVKIIAFMLCGMLSAVAGMLHSAQISQGGPNEGIGYELNAIAAVAIGGSSLAGGRGKVAGTLVGALILGLLDNMLGLKGVNSNLQLVVKGLLIIVAVFAQAERKKE
jgi:putative xylitol transport system permease protein